PGKPEFAAADGHGHIFDNIESKSELVEIDTTTDKVIHTWSLAPCKSPSGLALDVAHARIFSVCDNGVMAVTNARNGHHIATVAIGKGPDAVRFDTGMQTVFSSNGDSGTLTAVHEDSPDHYTVAATIPTQASARTEALDPLKHRIYLSSAMLSNRRNAHGWRIPVPGSFTLLVVGAH
ncbi:MAG: YncE family protein, partial [Oleiagrimonas sp.]|nr:YncE family protein [Oleiagrimonas sp.]